MQKFVVPMLALGVIASLVFSGCRPEPPEVPPYPEEMPCGMVVDLSGPNAEMGKRLSAGAEVAITQMNDWGGIRNMLSMDLRLIVADDGGSPAQAAAEAERLITEEEVIYLIGAWPTAEAISEVAEEHGVPFICVLDLEPITELGREFTFRTTPSAKAVAGQVVSVMTQSAEEAGLPPPKSCFLMYVPDAQGTNVAEVFKLEAEAAGIEIVGEETIDITTTSFASQLAAVEAAAPDLLFTCNYTDDAIIMYREMMERQISLPYGVYSWGLGLEDPAFYEALPLAAYEYSFVHESADPVPQERDYYYWINDAIQAKIGEDWDNPAIAASYHTIWLVKEGLERMTPVRRVSRPGVHEGMEFSLDLDKFRSNLQYAMSKLEITRADVEKVQLPDGSPFLPSLEVLRFERVEFDENRQMIYDIGMISENIDGTRWPMFPVTQRVKGSPSLVLPIPPWSGR
jgi:branched-chain amino acid transport system substrate-binding protein